MPLPQPGCVVLPPSLPPLPHLPAHTGPLLSCVFSEAQLVRSSPSLPHTAVTPTLPDSKTGQVSSSGTSSGTNSGSSGGSGSGEMVVALLIQTGGTVPSECHWATGPEDKSLT